MNRFTLLCLFKLTKVQSVENCIKKNYETTEKTLKIFFRYLLIYFKWKYLNRCIKYEVVIKRIFNKIIKRIMEDPLCSAFPVMSQPSEDYNQLKKKINYETT